VHSSSIQLIDDKQHGCELLCASAAISRVIVTILRLGMVAELSAGDYHGIVPEILNCICFRIVLQYSL